MVAQRQPPHYFFTFQWINVCLVRVRWPSSVKVALPTKHFPTRYPFEREPVWDLPTQRFPKNYPGRLRVCETAAVGAECPGNLLKVKKSGRETKERRKWRANWTCSTTVPPQDKWDPSGSLIREEFINIKCLVESELRCPYLWNIVCRSPCILPRMMNIVPELSEN